MHVASEYDGASVLWHDTDWLTERVVCLQGLTLLGEPWRAWALPKVRINSKLPDTNCLQGAQQGTTSGLKSRMVRGHHGTRTGICHMMQGKEFCQQPVSLKRIQASNEIKAPHTLPSALKSPEHRPSYTESRFLVHRLSECCLEMLSLWQYVLQTEK